MYALVVRHTERVDGVDFVTEPEHSQQVAYMKHKKGKRIEPHYHQPVKRVIYNTQEVLMVTRGSLRCDLYDKKQRYLQSSIIEEGDLLVLLEGGHGFSALSDIEMVEIKQGPYVGDKDKIRFAPETP